MKRNNDNSATARLSLRKKNEDVLIFSPLAHSKSNLVRGDRE